MVEFKAETINGTNVLFDQHLFINGRIDDEEEIPFFHIRAWIKDALPDSMQQQDWWIVNSQTIGFRSEADAMMCFMKFA